MMGGGWCYHFLARTSARQDSFNVPVLSIERYGSHNAMKFHCLGLFEKSQNVGESSIVHSRVGQTYSCMQQRRG